MIPELLNNLINIYFSNQHQVKVDQLLYYDELQTTTKIVKTDIDLLIQMQKNLTYGIVVASKHTHISSVKNWLLTYW